MDGQDHKITADSATSGHEGHGVHLCHRCGWPFPNPHPSAKHRRAHKRVCGKVEGYQIIQSGDHLAASDDDNASDDDDHHTPSPNIVKKNVASSGKGGEKSVRSEDDVFSDAVTDFSESGISPRLEERFESVKKLETKSVEGDHHEGGMLDVEEADDRTVESNVATSEEISHHGPLANGNNHPDNEIPITDNAAKLDSVDDSTPEHGVGKTVICEPIPEQDKDIQAQEHISVSEEGKVLDREESGDALHDKLVSEPLQTLDAPEKSTSKTVEETVESVDEEVSQSTENIGHTESVGENTLPDESLLSTASVKANNEHCDVTCTASSIDKEEIPQASLDESGGGKSDITGSVDLNSALGSTINACEDDATTIEKKDIDHCGENTDTPALETGNGKGEGAPVEVEVIPESMMPSGNSTDITSSLVDACEDDATTIEKKDIDHCGENTDTPTLETGNGKGEGAPAEVEVIPESMTPSGNSTDITSSLVADGDAKSLQELSENHSNEVKNSEDNVTDVLLQSVGSDANHDINDALDKNSLPSTEVANNNHVAVDVPEAECRDVAETPEASIPKETTTSLAAKNDSCTVGAANAPDSIITTEVTAKDLESNVVTPTPSVQEASSDIKQTRSSDDLTKSKSVDIIPSAEQLKSLPLDECLESTTDAPSVKQPVSSPSDVKDFHGASDSVDDTTPANVKDVTSISARSVLPEIEDESTKKTDDASAVDSLTSRSDSLEANCGSVVSDTLETNSQKHKTTTAEEANSDKSDAFEPPSFMTLVQSGSEGEKPTAATEIEAVQNNQQPKSDALQAGWFPSITNVVNESEGRKKNEEMIAKVTNWSPVKQQHGPLKSLLSEVKSPNAKQVPAENQKVEAETKDDSVGVTAIISETRTAKDETKDDKNIEEWNSPARYPIEIKKEKKKGRSFWVSFVCCSSAHRDL